MKKLCAVMICLLLSVPAYAASRLDYAGIWVSAHTTQSGGAICEFFYLAPTGQAFYMNESYDADGPSFGRQYLGTWNITDQGIHIVYGNNASADAVLSGDFLMIKDVVGYIPYGKAAEYSKIGASNISSKISPDVITYILPAGEYIVGKGLPSGHYIVKADTPDDDISFIVWDADGESLIYSHAVGNNDMMPADLEDGYTVNIWHGTAILSRAEVVE